MSEKVIDLKQYVNKKSIKEKESDNKSYEEILSDIYADDLTQEFMKHLGKGKKS